MEEFKFNTIEEAIADFKEGKFVVVVDDEDRENEGDFITSAELITPEKANFMFSKGKGLVCVPVTEDRCEELNLGWQVADNTSLHGTPFTVSVDLIGNGCTTGVSAYDRAMTIKALSNPETNPSDLARPGHIFPLKARHRGVLQRAGHTEATVDLARLAGLYPAGALVEIIDEDGTMARLPRLFEIAHKYEMKIISVKDLIAFRLKTESLIERGEMVKMPTKYGDFNLIPFRQKSNGQEHVALIKGEWKEDEAVLVRVHSSCMTGDIFGSLRCECGEQLHLSMQRIQEAGKGVLVYMNQEGRGIGLMNKIKAYKLQENGYDTVDANIHLGFKPDERDYGVGAQILRETGVKKMRLMTNNPVKRIGLESFGLETVEIVPIEIEPNEYNMFYIKTKKEKMGHTLKIK